MNERVAQLEADLRVTRRERDDAYALCEERTRAITAILHASGGSVTVNTSDMSRAMRSSTNEWQTYRDDRGRTTFRLSKTHDERGDAV